MIFPEQYRVSIGHYSSTPGSDFGAFRIPGKSKKRTLVVIACAATLDESMRSPLADQSVYDWDHVSVSVHGRTDSVPAWDEMCKVKNLFWPADQGVIQFHPPESEYKNLHPGCLHLWRHKDGHPTPPLVMV